MSRGCSSPSTALSYSTGEPAGRSGRFPRRAANRLPWSKSSGPYWTLSASGIYVLDPDAAGGPAIQFFPFAGDKRPEVLRLAGSPEDYRFATDRVDVSADGRWILYAYRDRNESDIMLVENFR